MVPVAHADGHAKKEKPAAPIQKIKAQKKVAQWPAQTVGERIERLRRRHEEPVDGEHSIRLKGKKLQKYSPVPKKEEHTQGGGEFEGPSSESVTPAI